MTDLFESLQAEVQSWIAGEMDSTEAHTVLDWVHQAKEGAKTHVEELEALRGPTELKCIEDAIADAKERHNQFIRLWNQLCDEVKRRDDEKFADVSRDDAWRNGRNVLSGDWRPINPAGTVTWCCNCGAGHVRDFRVRDGQLEMRVFNLPEKVN